MAEKVTIKKYSNRRLYDTEKNAYVTLQEVADLIKEGRQVEVVDAQSGEYVTSFILTQIVLEEAKKKNLLLPVPLLHLIIRYGETTLNEFFDKYLQQVLQNYITYKSTVDDQFAKWLNLGTDIAKEAKKSFAPLAPFPSYDEIFGVFSPRTEKEEKTRAKKKK